MNKEGQARILAMTKTKEKKKADSLSFEM